MHVLPVCFTMPAPYGPVRLMYLLNTEKAPVTETVPYNPVRPMVVKIRYIYMTWIDEQGDRNVVPGWRTWPRTPLQTGFSTTPPAVLRWGFAFLSQLATCLTVF